MAITTQTYYTHVMDQSCVILVPPNSTFCKWETEAQESDRSFQRNLKLGFGWPFGSQGCVALL